MLGAGFHHLANDADPTNVATYLELAGRGSGLRAAERMVRPYFKGRPGPLELARKAAVYGVDEGARVQVLNEPNLPSEGFGGSPADYAAYFAAVRHLVPAARLYWAGMSPGVPGWQSWYDPAADAPGVAGVATHAYGTFDEMRAVVEAVRDRAGHLPQWIAECNFGAGRAVDRDAWARDHLRPFLDWCAQQPDVEAVTYFAHRWPTPDLSLPTPVDAAGSAIETVIREWRAPVPTPAPITRARILENAARYDGVPYVWGGDSPTGLDCSAYVSRCWEVPRRGTDTLGEFYDAITKDQLRPGDAMNLVTTRDPDGSGHIRLFEKWANADRSRVWVWEETMGVTPGRVVHREIAYDPRYQPVRRVNVQESPAPAPAPKPAADNGARFGELWALKDRLYAIGDELLAQPDPRVKRLAAAVKGHGAGLEAEVAEFTRG